MPTGEDTKASTKKKLHHKVQEPVRIVDMEPNLARNSLLRASKFTNAKYVTVLTTEEVLIFDDFGDQNLAKEYTASHKPDC